MIPSRPGTNWVVIALVPIVYIIAGKLGLQLAFVHPSATAVWPPTGIALAALIVWGYGLWPGIFIGAFLVNVATEGSTATSVGIAVGNTLEGLMGAYLVNRFANGCRAFERPTDVFKFAALAGVGSTMVSATIGVASLAWGGYADWVNYGAIWRTWWLGDVAGALIVAPVLMLWSTSLRVHWRREQAMEAAVVGLLIVLVGYSVFGGLVFSQWQHYPLEVLCVPLLVWTAFRFTQREAATATLLMSGFAIVGTLHGYGPFARGTPNESLLLLQTFMGIMAMLALSVVAAVPGRKRLENVLERGRETGRPGDQTQANTQSHKMETLGRQAAGIAHDFNNLLTVIRGYNDLLKQTATLSEDQRAAIDQIAQATGRATSLTAQLLAYSRRQIVQPVALDLNRVVTHLDQLFRRLIGANIGLSTVLAPLLGLVRADPTQLEQVLLNLVVNARDAMGHGGQLTIETANIDLDDTYVRHHPGARPGPYVRLAVGDTGMGIDGATQVRMFEPFFTTKGEGQGTGLGLSIIYGIVKQSGGYITVDSEPGQGTTFEVYLPRIGDADDSARQPIVSA
ncbi:MAG TPA: MASE1 domain-containing protein [Nitrospiraceae bacterium]|jgi:signal transduction histidine kinase|nr:MASE1 domain-containing protein [Nitrospiraceae bacterium]